MRSTDPKLARCAKSRQQSVIVFGARAFAREVSAQAPQHFPRSAQRGRDAPTGRMFDIVNVLAQFFMARASRSAIRICEKSNAALDIKTRPQKLGKALSRVHGNIVEPV